MNETEIQCTTAGNFTTNDLTVQCSINQCGKIKDGIGFRFEDRGVWVLAYSDLEAIYLKAKDIRDRWSGPKPELPSPAAVDSAK